jgi:hypothetical protein
MAEQCIRGKLGAATAKVRHDDRREPLSVWRSAGRGSNLQSMSGCATEKWRNSPFLVNSHESERRSTQGCGLSGGFVSGRSLSRAEGSGERFGLQPLRTQESPSGFHLKPLAVDVLWHGSSRALIRRPPPGFHFHVAHLPEHSPELAQPSGRAW